MRVLIFCNGDIHDYDRHRTFIRPDDFLIGVDGGTNHIDKLGLVPNVILGDMDSVDKELMNGKFRDVEVKTFPTRKDYTDTELALFYTEELKADQVVFLGMVGNRFDHTLGNVFLLKKAFQMGLNAFIYTDMHEMYIVDKKASIKGCKGDLLSILPLSETVEGIYLRNLEYPLNNATVKMGEAIGISNVFLGDIAEIEVASGLLIVIKTNKEAV
ncbi:MAG: thiamine diphosphokinase [Firmicutes bacterium]|jgi:thiamine pyrophosphokinase|nr:thiamine diphosphokinase [Bacillota bacterium]